MKSLKTFYDTLQVPRNATIAALRTAHKTLSEPLQPEHHPEDPGAAARQLLLVNKALEVLIHPHAREAYDAWLNAHTVTTHVPTVPELVEPPTQASGSTKVSSEALAPLPTLDLDGFAAEVAAKARASATAQHVPPVAAAVAAPARIPAPAPIPNPAAKPASTLPPAVKPAALSIGATDTPSAPSGFPETLPYQPSDADDLPDLQFGERRAAATSATAPTATVSTAPAAISRAVVRRSPPLEALDWLRERPIALIAAVLGCVLLIAFAPWLWRASFGAPQSQVPAIAPLQPTYVEPPAEAVSAPAAVVEPVAAVEEPTAQQAPAGKPASKAKPRNAAKRVAEPKRAPEPTASVQQPEPVVAPAPLDAGGHSGFAPKCRWVTPTNWSCK